jgi:hypothetical protein
MSNKRRLLGLLIASAVMLAGVVGWGSVGCANAAPPGLQPDAQGVSVPYTGRLSNADGQPVADGAYDLAFALYTAETGGDALWQETQAGVTVTGGSFSVRLGSVTAIPEEALAGDGAWLSVAVRGPGESGFTPLNPRQRINAAASPEVSAAAGPACPHTHFGETWSGSIGWSNGGFIVVNHANGPSVWGRNDGGGNAVRGDGYGNSIGVYGEGASGPGVAGRSASGNGVEGYSTDGYGVFAHSDKNDSIYVDGAGQHALNIQSAGGAAIYVGSAGGSGVYVNSSGGDGITVNSATYDGIGIYSAGDDGVHVRPTVGGTCYRCGWSASDGFAVLSSGEVRSTVGYGASTHGFAEIVDVVGGRSDYETGDVLVASASGSELMERSAAPYSHAVVGVYSRSPAFTGGRTLDLDSKAAGVPVVIMGIVRCKVSAENGPIHPGDLLVTSSTPGHAMRAGDAQPGTVLGKALGALNDGTGTIQVLVMPQ